MRFWFARRLADQYREWLTPRGRYVFWVTAGFALIGLNTKQDQVFKVFAVTAAMLFLAAFFALLRAPRVQLSCALPARATAGHALTIPIRLAGGKSLLRPLLLSFPRNGVSIEPRQSVLTPEEDPEIRRVVTLRAGKRGRYVLRGPTVRSTDPLGLVGSRALRSSDQVLFVYPRFHSMESFRLPLGRRYQPGGIPLASHTGDSLEFLGTREYRQGDPIKHIHWRSWARVGEPVVMEFQEEYFSRIAIILDTFLPEKASRAEEEAFEGAISVVASVADYFSRSEYVVDIFAAGPDIYEVSAGRSLAYLENILDVLACLEPCHAPPFEEVGPALFEKLRGITSVVAVVQDWDETREAFLRRVKSFGVDMRVLLVREAPTRKNWTAAADELGEMSWIRPAEIERALESESR
ncbi:MAG TPA: DUF58 domain-containing protein [Vicinamibacteria bacterium]